MARCRAGSLPAVGPIGTVVHSSILMRRRILDEVGPYDPALPVAELWMRAGGPDDAPRRSARAAGRPAAHAPGRGRPVTRPVDVLHLLVTTSPGGGPTHVYDLVRNLSGDEFEAVVAAPRDGIFFDRFRDLGVPMVELPLSRLGVRHLA